MTQEYSDSSDLKGPAIAKERPKALPRSPIVCILGMHRSGTSCLAGCLEERGLYLGDVVNSAPHNRKGNKENIELREINDEVLAFNGGSWDRPPERVSWNAALQRRRDRHIASYCAREPWGFKDPRTLLTLPFWLDGDPNMRLVGTFRNPHAVAESLSRRPGLEPQLSPLDLWEIYNLKLLDYARRFVIPLLCFDWPPVVYVRALNEVARDLGLRGDPTAPLHFYDQRLKADYSPEEEDPHSQSSGNKIYEKLVSISLIKRITQR